MNEARNPYSPPMAPVKDLSDQPIDMGPLIVEGRRVPIGNCTRWIGDTFDLFFQRAWKWIGTMLVFFVLSLVISVLPFMSWLQTLFWPVAAGGIAYALDVQRRTRSFTLSDAFEGFGSKFVPLATVGCVSLLSYVVMFITIGIMVSADAAIDFALNPKQPNGTPPNFWSAMIVATVISFPITAATFLAAPLIMLHGLSPSQALTMSLFGCSKNILPWISFGVLMVLIIVLSMIPLLLGLFASLPVAVMAFYAMYRDIFIGEPS